MDCSNNPSSILPLEPGSTDEFDFDDNIKSLSECIKQIIIDRKVFRTGEELRDRHFKLVSQESQVSQKIVVQLVMDNLNIPSAQTNKLEQWVRKQSTTLKLDVDCRPSETVSRRFAPPRLSGKKRQRKSVEPSPDIRAQYTTKKSNNFRLGESDSDSSSEDENIFQPRKKMRLTVDASVTKSNDNVKPESIDSPDTLNTVAPVIPNGVGLLLKPSPMIADGSAISFDECMMRVTQIGSKVTCPMCPETTLFEPWTWFHHVQTEHLKASYSCCQDGCSSTFAHGYGMAKHVQTFHNVTLDEDAFVLRPTRS